MSGTGGVPGMLAQDRGEDGRYVGRPVPRHVEDRRLVSGRARYADNVRVAGCLHLAVLRSPIAHARLLDVDVAAARQRPGVVAVWTSADLAGDWVAMPPIVGPADAHKIVQWPLASGKLRYVGEPIAIVVASTAALAIDALEAIELDLEPLPAVSGIERALAGDVLIHEEAGTNVAFRVEGQRVGDVDAVLAEAGVVVRRRFVLPRVIASAMEPRATVVEPGPDGTLTVHTSTQVPHRIRDTIAQALGLDPATVRVLAPDVGGGFGPKLECYAEDLLAVTAARRLGRPVRVVTTRSEDFQTTYQGRGQIQDIEVSARHDGTLLGLRVHVTADVGGFLSRVGVNVPLNGDKVFPGCYRWQAYRFDATGVFTNAVPTAAYRGAGRPEASFGVERALDDLAAALGMDPAELRLRNFPGPDEFPFPSIGGLTFDSGDYPTALRAAMRAVDYDGVRAEQVARRRAGDEVQLGIGLAAFVDRGAVGPGAPEYAAVRVTPDGWVEVSTGLGPSGQGTLTSLAQIVADELAVELSRIRFLYGDTGAVPEGRGTFASRSMAVGGVAALNAAIAVAQEARSRAARLLEASPDDVVLADGRCYVQGSPDAAVGLFDLATAEPLGAEESYDPPGLAFPSGVYAAVTEVDTVTGRVDLRRLVAVDDAGRVVNPLLFEGQVHGGLAQGLGQALYEEASYDEDGNLVAGTLADYLVPSAPDLPTFELHQVVSPALNALGAKGVGESGTTGGPPAVVNAVVDALRHLGVDDVGMPCTPRRVWEALRDAAGDDVDGGDAGGG